MEMLHNRHHRHHHFEHVHLDFNVSNYYVEGAMVRAFVLWTTLCGGLLCRGSCGVGVSLVWVVLHYSELLQTTGQHNIYTNKTSERSKCVMESLEAQRCKGKHNHSH